MNKLKRIGCILLGGCIFGADTKCVIDDNDIVTISETCSRCGKVFSFSVPCAKFGEPYYNLLAERKTCVKTC